jgi:hypothetical protein
MSTWRRIVVLAIWVASVAIASQWPTMRAQSSQPRTPDLQAATGQLYSGADVGFILFPSAKDQSELAGTLVIRQQGKWVPVQLARAVSPGDSRQYTPLR